MKVVRYATSDQYPDLHGDDLHTLPALARLGIEVKPWIWTTPGTPTEESKAPVVIRSCWNYYLFPEKFLAWLSALNASGVKLINSYEYLRWNLDKSYLLELQARGVSLPPTRSLERTPVGETSPSLSDLLRDLGVTEAVVKPRISASSFQTFRVSRERAPELQTEFASLLSKKALLVQEFLPQVADGGEISCIFFAGEFSHAVRKVPAAGDFRVQSSFGGQATSFSPDARWIAQAVQVVKAAQQAVRATAPPLYARVDGIDAQGTLELMELEIIDPQLFFPLDPASSGRFAQALARVL